jgi:hypothetical protein
MALPPESHRLRPDHLPTPFSAEQIRDGSTLGLVIRMREEEAGMPVSYRRVVIAEVDAESVVHEHQATEADGRPIGEPTQRRSTWLELQGHASQPAESTTVQEVALELPFGVFDCWLYTARRPPAEMRFWFAKELPGHPVQIEEWVDGVLASRSLTIGRDLPPVAPAEP